MKLVSLILETYETVRSPGSWHGVEASVTVWSLTTLPLPRSSHNVYVKMQDARCVLQLDLRSLRAITLTYSLWTTTATRKTSCLSTAMLRGA